MVLETFISPEFSMAIQNYLSTKEQPFSGSLPFPVIIIRTLVFIYGELDIINPYITKNEKSLGGFDSNLTKYGFSSESLSKFKTTFISFVKTMKEQVKPNYLFLQLEKDLIDMFCLKNQVMHLSEEEISVFKEYICFSNNSVLQDYLHLFIQDPTMLDRYFASKLYYSNHSFQLIPVHRKTLYLDAYLLLGYSANQIANMSDQELNTVNEQVYQFFKIPVNEKNRSELLVQAVNYYKRYGNRLTSGNGYVDLLLLLSVLATIVFLAILMAFRLF